MGRRRLLVCQQLAGSGPAVHRGCEEALQSPGSGTVATLEAEVREIIDATQEVGNDLQELDPPDTEEGEEAKRELDTLATQLEATATNIEETFDNLPEDAGLSDLTNALEPLVPTIQSLIASVSSTFDAVKESGSELKEGFDNADSCDEFR